jgi:NTE family protein
MIGAGFAGGLSPAEMEAAFLELRAWDFLSFYLARLRIGRSSAVGRKILSLGRQLRLEELPLPCALVAVDLQRKERVVLRQGPVVRAISAAIAIPFVSGPTRIGGRRLYDGGLIDPIPSDLPYKMGAERVIAVDVGQPICQPALARLGGVIKLMPPLREVGNLLELMGGRRPEYQSRSPDLVISPDLTGIGPNSFRKDKIVRAIAQGEAAAQAALPHIRELAARPGSPML